MLRSGCGDWRVAIRRQGTTTQSLGDEVRDGIVCGEQVAVGARGDASRRGRDKEKTVDRQPFRGWISEAGRRGVDWVIGRLEPSLIECRLELSGLGCWWVEH